MSWVAGFNAGRVREFYGAIGIQLPEGNGEASVSCFASPEAHRHEDRRKSCSVNLANGLWKCHGCGEHGNAYQAALYQGWREGPAADLAKQCGLWAGEEERKPFSMGGGTQWKKWMEALWSNATLMGRLYQVKGWTRDAIQRCGLGWDGARVTMIYTEPGTYNGVKIVGLARYLPNGTPKTIANGKRQLWPRPELFTRDRVLFVVEGEPDAVSMRSLGFQATAVPGSQGWKSEWAHRLAPFKHLRIMCDCDPAGRELAGSVKRVLPLGKVIDLDPARQDGFDIGDLVAEAARETAMPELRRVVERMAV